MLRKCFMICAAGLVAASAAGTVVPSGRAAAAATTIGTAWSSEGWGESAGSAPATVDGSGSGQDSTGTASSPIEAVIAKGMHYIGTPYEFGSDRSTDTTFDCSDLIRWIFSHAAGIELPADSRGQGKYVKDKGAVQTDWHQLKRGDLMFFMAYRGASASAYGSAAKSDAKITHVALYLGDGKILQTYSKDSGGVRVDTLEGSTWEKRFLYGGSAL